jgi:hypothetical protein
VGIVLIVTGAFLVARKPASAMNIKGGASIHVPETNSARMTGLEPEPLDRGA